MVPRTGQAVCVNKKTVRSAKSPLLPQGVVLADNPAFYHKLKEGLLPGLKQKKSGPHSGWQQFLEKAASRKPLINQAEGFYERLSDQKAQPAPGTCQSSGKTAGNAPTALPSLDFCHSSQDSLRRDRNRIFMAVIVSPGSDAV